VGIIIENVKKTFGTADGKGGTVEVFSGVDLKVRPGEFVSLLGPSGCGKSTLLNIVAGLERANSGNVTVNGRGVVGPGADRGVVFQEAALMPWLTVKGNVIFGIKKIMSAAEAEGTAEKYLKMVHLSRFSGAYPHELSGGMKQRVAIARALAMDPETLLMDEPFGALDEQTRSLLHKQVLHIWGQTGKTVLFVTHNIREAMLLSDRIVLMGVQPGGIRKVFAVELPRPRDSLEPEFAEMEQQIRSLLSVEIDKVAREEFGDVHSD
jgi:NitT/TauT family transport system ATP-binding protein